MTFGSRILVVSPDVKAGDLVCRALMAAGYAPSFAETFELARDAIAADVPDLLLVDLRLGAFNGLHLVSDAPPALPSIIMSEVTDDVEGEALALGSACIAKPIAAAALVELIGRVLAAAKRRKATGSRRRWERKTPIRDLSASIDGATVARIVDVSYGGVRLALDQQYVVPQAFEITLGDPPVSVNVMTVCESRVGGSRLCGAVLSSANVAMRDWVKFVDRLE
jgi:DNA-binding response OmpR family regulator